ncbi:anthranilate synthase component I family protein, partial [Thermodesulfobacteriota bacterium]
MEINLRQGGIDTLVVEDLEGVDAGPADLFRAFRSAPGSALLLSGGGLDASKYSIIGHDPFLVLTSRGDRIDIVDRGDSISLRGDPFEALRQILRAFRAGDRGEDLPLTSGGIGYLGYELGRHIEKLPCGAVDDLGLPDLYFAFYRTLLLHEHRTGRTRVASLQVAGDPDGTSPRQRIDDVRAAVLDASGEERAKAPCVCRPPVSNFTREAYLEAVGRIIRYIIDGDIYQANLSQRFTTEYDGDPYDLFCRLFRINPAPFFAYLDPGDFQVISSSPERFLNVGGSRVETRPIKGTSPRSPDPETDRKRAEGLLVSEKDSAELSMIVDLLRNDLGKVCRFGSVEVG